MNTLDQILSSIQAMPLGLSLGQLLALYPEVPRRTMQRWLADLVASGRIVARGQARARVYLFRQTLVSPPNVAGSVTDVFPSFIPLSADSRDVLTYVNQAVAARKPVAYQRDFLDDYRANHTWYLSPSLRRQLWRMGKTSEANAPAGTYSRAILNRLLIDLSWASSHLEGNTYSRLDTLALIEHGTVAQGKAAIETQMILNHKNAIELLADNSDVASFDRFTLMNLHSALAENLLPNPEYEGRIRRHAVEIGQSVYRPLADMNLLDEMFDLMLEKVNAIDDPFEQSFFMMVHLPYLQPFSDVNKRTSRLAANLPLFRANLCPLTFLDVPESAYSRAMMGVYELTRV
ncbi:MAG: Fic family protein, partial [Undibacterium sp.]|nr:Fic family protein [Undibacterium sp.]